MISVETPRYDAAHVASRRPFVWPAKRDVFGVQITPTTYRQATEAIVEAARRRRPGIVSCYAVHALMELSGSGDLREMANAFDMITPDGQPVRWALNLLHRAGLRDRVYGPELTLRICRRAAELDVPIYLYGGSAEVIDKLQTKLKHRFPQLKVAGAESPPFRALTPEEDEAMVGRVNCSGAGIVFIGLGCPKQDIFAYEHRHRIDAVQVCVGAAFDFHAGNKRQAPAWMQRTGLEWFFRLSQEPGRLWRRYLVTNTAYVVKLARTLARSPSTHKQKRPFHGTGYNTTSSPRPSGERGRG